MTKLRFYLKQINFKNFRFVVSEKKGLTFLHVEFYEVSAVTQKIELMKSRKWYLSEHMTKDEIIQTAFLAVKTALEHELREQFTYRGAPIFSPHYNVDSLVELHLNPENFSERT